MRIYLDNCCYNRPYDDQTLLKNHLEAMAKTYIQAEILNGNFELGWSYVLDFEISFNPFSNRKQQILKWKRMASVDIEASAEIVKAAELLTLQLIKPKDALHLICAREAQCDYFITTDKKLLKKSSTPLPVINPIDFLEIAGDKK